MKKIICIMGKSGSGKTTLIENLLKKDWKYTAIESYTTRAPREPNEWGHIFVDNEFYETHKDRAIAMYHSNHGYHSWITDDCFFDEFINLFAIDSKEFVKFSSKHNNDYEIFGIYLDLDEEERKNRLEKRDGNKNYYSIEEHLSSSYLNNCKICNYKIIDISKLGEKATANKVHKIIKEKINL